MAFAKTTPAPKPRNEKYKIIAWVYAAILVVISLGQLYAFEKFIPLIQEYGQNWSEGRATVLAAVIVIFQVFALPFLLRIQLSPLMRLCSAVCALAVPFAWLLLSFVAVSSDSLAVSGILGAKVTVPMALQIALALVMLVLSVATIWGFKVFKK